MDKPPYWLEQFRETHWEKEMRWRRIKQKRIAEGKCWQCAKLIKECNCSNIKR